MANRLTEIITNQSSPLRLRLSIITLHLIKLVRYSNLVKLWLEVFFFFFVTDKFNYLWKYASNYYTSQRAPLKLALIQNAVTFLSIKMRLEYHKLFFNKKSFLSPDERVDP